MKIGLFFGSFNPIHMGHLILARYWLNETDLSQIWFVVSPHNPHKSSGELASIEDRLVMARLAVANEPRIQVSDIELSLPRPSYTIQTLEQLKQSYSGAFWAILLGADTALGLPTWREGKRILSEWEIWVYPRQGVSLDKLPQAARLRTFPEAPRIDLSATQIRNYRAMQKSICYLVPSAVERYILEKGLYASSVTTP
ncbi:MAG: nicotinate (nicotinamide) nucleotide adenylyltransferase [Bacteroidia bacterium]|nr:nicotinate (nicotinamide) nucleotide adenylyltransferase [Bacteroidia bacterium]